MAGNALGTFFRITTFGESHGKAVGVLIDGVAPNVPISAEDIQKQLDRRRPGQSNVTTSRNEADQVHILSGVFEGKTLGTPICLLIWNRDQNSAAYEQIKNLFRPGHAGYTYLSKYGIQDFRGGGRSSGRETAGRVAGGALARKILEHQGIQVTGFTRSVGSLTARKISFEEIERNPVRCPDPKAAKKMERFILRTKNAGDSIGGIVEVVVRGCPAGLGEPVFDKLEADFAKALMSIPAIKGVEIGSGFSAAKMLGSRHNDEFTKDRKGRIRTVTNFAGGILGGISNGEDIVLRIAVKPPSSIPKAQKTVDTKGRRRVIKVEGRHDPCLCPRVVPVAESMVALVLADHLMRQKLLRKKKPLVLERREIDFIDDMILLLLDQRQELVRDIGKWKRSHRRAVASPRREREIMLRRLSFLKESTLDPGFVRSLYQLIFRNSRAVQKTA